MNIKEISNKIYFYLINYGFQIEISKIQLNKFLYYKSKFFNFFHKIKKKNLIQYYY
jgi:hypothetical protein